MGLKACRTSLYKRVLHSSKLWSVEYWLVACGKLISHGVLAPPSSFLSACYIASQIAEVIAMHSWGDFPTKANAWDATGLLCDHK